MNFNFLKKRFITNRVMITFLSLLAILVISLLIYGYDSMHDPEKVKARLYACGKFGDQQMHIDRRYLFLARVEYQGVNYWGKNNIQEHQSKGCKDQIQNVSFNVRWPEMSPSNGFELNSKEYKNITFTLTQRGSWPIEWGDNKNIINQIGLLRIFVNDSGVTDFEISDEQINAKKVFNQDLGLYQITLSKGGDKVAKHIYWQEKEGKRIGVVISCQNYFSNKTGCELYSHVPNYGFYTSVLDIDFHGELLPHWKQLRRDSLKLVDSFKVGEI